MQDTRFAARQLRKSPAFSVAAILTLALGVGATTAIFSVVKAVLLDQLPYRDPSRIVAIEEARDAEPTSATVHEWKVRSRSFKSWSVYRDAQSVVDVNGEASVLRGMRVSWDFFDTLGVRMQLGRTFLREEDRPDHNFEVIFSHRLWVRLFGADPNIIGRTLDFRTLGRQVRVVGVLPASFHPLHMTNPIEWPEYFMPIGIDLSAANPCRACGGSVIARLTPGVKVMEAETELNAVMRNLIREYPNVYASDSAVIVKPLRDQLVGRVSIALWVVFGAVGFVLLIACSNLANLSLARATARARETAVRVALGCGRWQLVRQLLTEHLILGIVAGLVGVLLARWGVSVFRSIAGKELPRADEIHVDMFILLFGLGVSLGAGILSGLVPALRASRVDLANAMKQAGESEGGRSHTGLQNLLVIAQVALAFILSAGSGLLGKSFARLLDVDPGFDFHHVLTLTTVLYGERYNTWDAAVLYYEQAAKRIQAIPGVEGAALVNDFPLTHADPHEFHIQERVLANEADAPRVNRYLVSPDYFRVMKIPIKRGRTFTGQDDLRAPPAVLISDSCAQSQFPGEDPIGKHIRLGPEEAGNRWATIVGVVGNVRSAGLDSSPDRGVYFPLAQNESYYRMVIRTKGDPIAMLPAVRAAFREIDPTQPIWHILPMEAYVASSVADRRFTLALVALFGLLALILASVGIYGVISYLQRLRTRELGLRMALGAEQSAVLLMVVRQALAMLGWGLATGFLGVLALTRLFSHLLYEVQPTDLTTIGTAAFVLACTVLMASYLPARRAAAIDPMSALRHE